MRIARGGSAAAGLALCLGALFACGGGSGGGSGGAPSGTPGTAAPSGSGSRGATAGGTSVLKGKVIVLDPGHNGGNAGHPEEIGRQVFVGNGSKACNTTGTATAEGYAEHAFTWDVAGRLARLLRDRGASVTLTRRDDTGVGPCVDERAAIANRLRADAALSIHGDGAAPSGHGFHVIEPLPVGGNAGIVAPSARLGTAIRDAYRDGTGVPPATYVGLDGLDRRDDLGGLNLSRVPAVFIECGNMRNTGDAAQMSSAPFRQRMAEALARGFEHYLG
ncbi:N-acetylmuramoyl-L-alanine amidase [Actinomadura fibrosa]|uniref:N-acetylmuramoyl-L-alanine amidase n=1 Tax=Actinomadura fibrosa TaxID=111802 RepID=A0ABW2XY32_9ACTN|nr:N-acetylmuramoyl-L-alanine amidase [Actinomadura fibrosa]